MTFAEKLVLLRKARGMSQEELAGELNVSRQAVGKWEGGQSLPETDKLPAISELFGVTIDYLLSGRAQQGETGNVHVRLEAETKSRRFVAGVTGVAAGALVLVGVLLAAAINLPTTYAWYSSYPSKLWFLIFAGKSPFGDGADGLALGPVFVFGAVVFVLGVVFLVADLIIKKKAK